MKRRGGDQAVLVVRRTQPSPAEPSRAQPKRASPAAATAAAAAPRPGRPPPSGSSALLPGKPPDHAWRPTRFCDPPAPRSPERLQSSRCYARHAGERGGGTLRPHPEGAGPALPSASSAPFAACPSWSSPSSGSRRQELLFHCALHPFAVPTPSYPPGAAISVSAAAFIPPLAHPADSGILLPQVPFPLWVLPPNPMAYLCLVFPIRAAFQPCGGSAGLWDWRAWGFC